MSAWIVSKEHIDVLVTALHPETQEQSNELGRVLWRECFRSVAYRYPDDADGERPGPISFRDSDVDTYVWSSEVVPHAWISNAAACYDYQSCEHPEYGASVARYLVSRLMDKFPSDLYPSRNYDKPVGPGNPPWGIDSKSLSELRIAEARDAIARSNLTDPEAYRKRMANAEFDAAAMRRESGDYE